MSHVSALLGVLHTHNGNELILETGAAPTFMNHGQVLKLFLRPIGAERHKIILDEVLNDEARAIFEGTGSATLDFASERGEFTVYVTGQGERIRFAAVEAEVPDVPEAPEPSDVSAPDPVAANPQPSAPPSVTPAVAAPGPKLLDTTPRPPSAALEQLLHYAVEVRASDLHVASGEVPTLRSDGRLQPLGNQPSDTESLLASLLSPHDHTSLACGTSVDRAVQTSSGARFRANIYRHTDGLAAAFRVLRPAPPSLAALKLAVDLRWIPKLPHGLVLFTGPTGSGKSTTMASLAREFLQTRGGLLITLEDPIEYTFTSTPTSLVRQREIGRHVADFPTGLRDALREDPDVLLVGEMRDEDSIRLALTAAETGHLVLASLHSRSAPAAVERIVDAYPGERQHQIRVQLADALRGVVAQQLLPRIGGGRVAATEVLRVTQAAANCIREGKTPALVSVMQTGHAEGMLTMERCVDRLVEAGQVDLKEVS